MTTLRDNVHTFFLDMRRWWREFWSGRQNGLDGYCDALEWAAEQSTQVVEEVCADFQNWEDRYDFGYLRGLEEVLRQRKGQ